MPIAIVCSSCRGKFKAPDNAAGRTVKCPKCGSAIDVPNQPDEVRRPKRSDRPRTDRGNKTERSNREATNTRPKCPVVLLIAGGGIFAVLAVFGILWAIGVFSPSKKESAPPSTSPIEVAKAPSGKTTTDDKDPGKARPGEVQPIKKADEKELAQNREEERKAVLAKAIKNAEPLMAPPLIQGKGTNINDFSPIMRKLVGYEFNFKDAQKKVYRATFNQWDIEASPLIKIQDARNALVHPGTYDFDAKRSTWRLHLWHIHWDEKKIGTNVYPETTDACTLVAAFNVDEATARKWREAFDQKSLELTVWFRPVKVQKGNWKVHPRFNDGTQTHDIVIDTEVLQFEAKLDKPPK